MTADTRLLSSQSFRTALMKALILTVFTAVSLVVLFPLLALVISALRPGRDLMRFGITFDSLFAGDKSMRNFYDLFFAPRATYGYWFKNSLMITAVQTISSVFLTSLVGYGLAVYNFKGRNLLITLVLILMMVPLQILILPLYKLMIGLNLMDKMAGVILPFLLSPVAIFFFRQFCLGLPLELMDAARIDGVTELGIYFRIMTPLMLPAFGAMGILVGLQSWNNYLWPLIVLRTTRNFTIPIGLNSKLTPYGNNYEVLISGSVVAIIPIVVLFIFFQKYFVSGLSSGSLKG